MPNPNLVSNLGSSKVGNQKGEYFVAGHHFKVLIDRCVWVKARDTREMFIANTQILESDCEDQGPGRKPSYTIVMNNDMGQMNLGTFLRLALTALAAREGQTLDPDDDAYWEDCLDHDLLCEVVGQPNILAGVELYLYTKPITTKAGNPFTVHEWSLTPTKK